MKKINTMLFRMITTSKSQYIAVLVIIITGLMVFTAMNIASINLTTTLETYYTQSRFADLYAKTVKVPQQEVLNLSKIAEINTVEGRIVFDVPYTTDNKDERVNIRIVTVPLEDTGINNLTVVKGTYIGQSARDILVLQQFAEARGIKVGDEMDIQINGVGYLLNVAGIVASPEYIYAIENGQSLIPDPKAFGVVYIPETLGQQAFGYQNSYNEIMITYNKGINEEKLIDTLKEELAPFGLQRTIKKENQLSNNLISDKVASLKRTSNSLPIVFLIVAAIMLAMMIGRMVKRDRIKIGVLQAMGYSKGQVLLHYAGYALSAGLIGGFMGATLGMLLAGIMTSYYLVFFNIPLFKIDFYYVYVFTAMLISAGFCALAGLVGARGVLKISPAESMQSEAPRKGKRILLERLPFFWKKLSFSWKLVIKNIFRNKKRAVFVLFGVIFTYAMLLFTMAMPAVINELMVKSFTEFQTMDYNISFRVPVNDRVLRDFRTLVNVDHIEGKIEYPFELQNGSKTKAVPVVGLNKDTSYYNFKDGNGNKVAIPDEGMLLTQNLANILNAHKGDALKIKTYLPGRSDVYVTVVSVVKQSLGINAYMNIDYMDQLLLEKNAITGVYLDSKDQDIGARLAKVTNISTIQSPGDMKKLFDQYIGLTLYSLVIMIFFAGLMGFVIVYNATMISVSEREMEFSSLRVLGFSKGEIYSIVLKENNVITVTGILLGIPLGIWMTQSSSAFFTTELYSLTITPTLTIGIAAAAATIAFVVLAQAATFIKISRLDFLQALKNRVS